MVARIVEHYSLNHSTIFILRFCDFDLKKNETFRPAIFKVTSQSHGKKRSWPVCYMYGVLYLYLFIPVHQLQPITTTLYIREYFVRLKSSRKAKLFNLVFFSKNLEKNFPGIFAKIL